LLSGTWAGAWAAAQDVPEFTKERQKAVNELFDACIEGGGLALADTPGGKGKYLRVADRAKLKATLAARKDTLTPDLRDGLTAFWFKVKEPSEATVVALLEAFGEVKLDQQALGWPPFSGPRGWSVPCSGRRRRTLTWPLQTYFEAAGQPPLQACATPTPAPASRTSALPRPLDGSRCKETQAGEAGACKGG